jgi:cytochrome c peroxidase
MVSPAKVALGRRLFSDKRLSADATIACADCHDLARGGADGRPHSIGVGGRLGEVNAPTVFNAGANPKQFWDGRADSLESQIDGPIQNPKEMAATWPDVVAKVAADPSYAAGFSIYRDGVTPANIKDAIASFERTLVTSGSRFDAYLAGDEHALSRNELNGYAVFKSYGCANCHQGRNVGGNVFEPLGLMGDYFGDRGGEITQADLGRFNVTGRPEDRFRFRVPSLRLVALTAPYFHDGSIGTLETAIVTMARYQLATELSAAEVAAIAEFLGSLAGDCQDAPRDGSR